MKTIGSQAAKIGIGLLSFCLMAEICGVVGLWVLTKNIPSYGRLQKEQQEVRGLEAKGNQDEQNGARVIHPYLGFATPPQSITTLNRVNGEPLEEYGFDVGSGPLVMERDPQKFVIGIFGGSVAKQLWEKRGTDALIETLKQSPSLRDKEIVISSGSFYSFRQPQQMLSLAYLLSLGAHFDAVILLDGFNDIFRPDIENMNGAVSPLYPYGWAAYTGDLNNDPVFRLKFGKVALLDEMRFKRAQRILHSPLRFSMAANLLWKVLDRRTQAESLTAEYQLQNYMSGTGTYAMRGPKIMYDSEEAYFRDRAAVWRNGSIAMRNLSNGQNIAFYHFLQPNQYLPDSKPIHPDEQYLIDGLPIWAEPGTRHAVEKGYPYLQREGESLLQADVRFHDLTKVFADVTDPLYVDPCCHVNEQGNTILGKRIGALMLEDMAAKN